MLNVSDNPVAAALLSKMGFKPEEKVRVKLEFMRMLTRMKLDPARMELLGGFFETYLKLTRTEEEQLYRELDRIDSKEADAIMQITTSWHEKGKVEGKAEAKKDAICKYLKRRFGPESAGLQQKVQEMTTLEVLDGVMEELFAVNTLEEARVVIMEGIDRFVQ